MLREYDLLGPLEGVSGLIIGLDKGVDLIAQLAWRGEARAGQGFGGENGEPYLHLIEPGGMGRRKMEMDVLVPRQPAVVFGLVGIEIVQNHMDLPAGMIGNQAVHEIQELDATAALIMAGLDQASGNIEGGEQGRGAVTFVCMAEPCHRFAIGQLQPALGDAPEPGCAASRRPKTPPRSRAAASRARQCRQPSAQTPDRC